VVLKAHGLYLYFYIKVVLISSAGN